MFGADINPKLLQVAKRNAERAGVAPFIQWSVQDAGHMCGITADEDTGVVLSNLPYGERLGSVAELVTLHRQLGLRFKRYFQGWRLALLASDDSLLQLLKLSKSKRYQFKNGPLDVTLNLYHLSERQVQQSSSRDHALHFESSQAFANRLKKNRQALKSWVKREQIQAYRVYDADIPEYNVAVDLYPDAAVIFEYAAPKQIDPEVAKKRLQDVISLTASQLELSADQIAVKVRKKQKGDAQYHSFDQQQRFQVVEEFGAKLRVNLYDYLDTGLFLDHRYARRYIQQQAKDKRVLNLFAYTGSASVHAALGGATSILTIDLSKTYLNWAKENFVLNDLRHPKYRFEQADCLAWLASARGQYDLIFLDPPTFSNSKRMEQSFDVQRDHLQLLAHAKKLLSPEGQLLFSNNKRGFKMDHDGLKALGLNAQEFSSQTLSPDFKRNQQIHNSWLIRHG